MRSKNRKCEKMDYLKVYMIEKKKSKKKSVKTNSEKQRKKEKK